MRILFVSQYFWPEDFRANDIVLGLKERGHEVTVVTGLPNYPGGSFFKGYSFFRGPFREEWNGIEILRSPMVRRASSSRIMLALNYITFAIFCSAMLMFRRPKADIVFCWMVSPVTQVFPAIVAKWLLKGRLVLWVMDLWPDSLSASGRVTNSSMIRLMGRVTRWIYQRCDLILGQSRRFVSHITAVGNMPPDKVVYLPQWEPAVGTGRSVAMGRPTLPEGFRVVFTGNVGHSQDFDTILDAAKQLSQQHRIQWIIVGEGDALSSVRERAVELGLTDCIHTPGRYPFEMMPYFYSEADVLLATLKPAEIFSRTIPTKIQSYLTSGKPLVTAIDGEVAEIVKESGAGLAVAAGDASALAAAIEQLFLTSCAERTEMGKRGQAYCTANFDREYLLDRLTALLEEEVVGNTNSNSISTSRGAR
jgi:colanic acid biosynthesis glycosyl transferase WcaI